MSETVWKILGSVWKILGSLLKKKKKVLQKTACTGLDVRWHENIFKEYRQSHSGDVVLLLLDSTWCSFLLLVIAKVMYWIELLNWKKCCKRNWSWCQWRLKPFSSNNEFTDYGTPMLVKTWFLFFTFLYFIFKKFFEF